MDAPVYKILVVPLAAVTALALLTGCVDRAPGTAASPPPAGSITPNALAVDGSGNVYIADVAQHVVDEVSPDGHTTTVVAGVSGNGGTLVPGPATGSPLSNPSGLAVDAAGNLYVADSGTSQVIGVVAPDTGNLAVLAGTLGVSGALVPGEASSSPLATPVQLATDAGGDVYVADNIHGTVDRIDTAGALTVVAGRPGTFGVPVPGPATSSSLYGPTGVAVDGAGNVYIADLGNHVVEKVDTTGTLSIVAGTVGESGTPTAGPATDSALSGPAGLAVDGAGDLYIADAGAHVVVMVATDGTLSIVAGTPGTSGTPTPGPATASALDAPSALAVAGDGTVYIADTGNNLVEKVSGGVLSTFAGTGATTAMTKIQLLAAAAITQRTHALQLLIRAVNASQWLSPDTTTAATALLQSSLDALLALGKQLSTDTVTAKARAHYQAVFVDERVFALRVQQVYLAAAADDLVDAVLPAMNAAYTALRARLSGPDASQATPRITTLMNDLQTQITLVTNATSGLAATVLAFTPAQWNQNRQLLAPARSGIGRATAATARGDKDIATILAALGDPAGSPVQARRAVIDDASAAIARDVGAAARAQAQNDQPVNVPGS